MSKLDVTTLKFYNIINGKPVSSSTLHAVKLADVPDATPEQLYECVVAARIAQKSWGAKSYEERGAVLSKIADDLEGKIEAQVPPDVVGAIVPHIQSVLPPGALSILNGDNGLGPLVAGRQGIEKIAFTGSTQTGKRVIQGASVKVKPITLELDTSFGPRSILVLFQNSAQFCNVVRGASVAYARSIHVGDSSDENFQLRPVQNKLHELTDFIYDKLKTYFEDCMKSGYTLLGGNFDLTGPGLFIPITIVDNLPDNSKIVTEEPFGPIVPILRWSDEADVIKRTALAVWVNEISTYSPLIPFGGVKQSGLGVENGYTGPFGYRNYQRISTIKALSEFNSRAFMTQCQTKYGFLYN
ncbi:ALDH-like protein [Ceratobasidium sp. AG-I]|nr:ALDH-like protein [Ceratobasidium sp. AG-I]